MNKHSLVEHILNLLDNYLKCFVDGGFIEEEFIFELNKTKDTKKEFLEKKFINMKKYLLSLIEIKIK